MSEIHIRRLAPLSIRIQLYLMNLVTRHPTINYVLQISSLLMNKIDMNLYMDSSMEEFNRTNSPAVSTSARGSCGGTRFEFRHTK